MGKKGTKSYIRVCKNHHSQFEGYRLPVGAYYGRNGNIFFVFKGLKTDGNTKFVADLLKEGNEKGKSEGNDVWKRFKVPFESEIGKMITAFIKEKGNPNVGSYNKERKKEIQLRDDQVMVDGKIYTALSYEHPLPEIRISKEARETGDCPKLVGMMEANLTGGRHYRSTETENTEEPFIRDSVVIGNECSYWAIGVDMIRRG